MDQLELRELRYFVTVAEELHFSRAAERLGIAQPPLSRAVQQLERRLGVALLTRNRRGVALTGAGQVLLDEARALLDGAAAAVRRTRRAATAGHRLVLATKAGANHDLLQQLLATHAASSGADTFEIDVVLCGLGDQARMLRDGRADVALMQRPFDTLAGFDTEDLLTEQQVAILPAAHRLATRPALSMADLAAAADLPIARWPDPDGTYPPGPGPQIRDLSQLAQLIALGQTAAVLCASSRTWLWDAHAAIPLTDAPHVTTVLAWPATSRSKAVAALVRAATGR